MDNNDLPHVVLAYQYYFDRRTEWQGTVGQPPMEQQVQNALKQKDIYM
jgi:hypothetical protein